MATRTRAEHAINVGLTLDGPFLAIHIDDDGVACSTRSMRRHPGSTCRSQQRRIGGLGVHMMKTLAKSVGYTRDNERNNLDIVIQVGAQDESGPA